MPTSSDAIDALADYNEREVLTLKTRIISAVVGLLIYLVIFTVCDAINMPRGQRWFNRLGAAVRGKK